MAKKYLINNKISNLNVPWQNYAQTHTHMALLENHPFNKIKIKNLTRKQKTFF